MSIQRYPLTLSFKGERDYIQGPDIFDAVIQALCAGAETTRVAQIDVAFHRLARHAVELINDDQGSAMDPVAICQYSIDGVRRQAFVVETGTEIVERHPYPEEDIIERMSIDTDQRTCALDIDLPFTDMELWVSMTKALHKALFPELNGKWLFVRARFEHYAPDAKGFRTLAFKSNFNNKLTRCEAMRDGVKVGEIYFSIV
ncbi:hypothetical protein [Herbaspirillum camelliae]|uniref:hypothetical protein n=1 Tax=Herbaspirillum camelliae TaxID=1892903 RepID=UPI001179D6E8|nr:hypothetical protein [Herbaspirillum camelliae]